MFDSLDDDAQLPRGHLSLRVGGGHRDDGGARGEGAPAGVGRRHGRVRVAIVRRRGGEVDDGGLVVGVGDVGRADGQGVREGLEAALIVDIKGLGRGLVGPGANDGGRIQFDAGVPAVAVVLRVVAADAAVPQGDGVAPDELVLDLDIAREVSLVVDPATPRSGGDGRE